MVYLTTDELLALGLPLLYLASSVLLLERDEVALATSNGAVVRVDLGSDFLLAGRRPALANPLTPYRAVFRGTWGLTDSSAPRASDTAQELATAARALRPVGVLSSIAGASAVIAAPWALIQTRSDWFLVFWAVCVVASIVSGGIALRRRALLKLSRGAVVWMTALAVVCIPLAGLLCRTFASQIRPRVRLPEFAEHTLRGAPWNEFREQFVGLLQRFRLQTDEGSRTAADIDRLMSTLEKKAT